MKYGLHLVAAMLIFNLPLLAQEQQPLPKYRNNAVFIETGGPSLIYSMGYERNVATIGRFSFPLGVGFSYIPTSRGSYMGYLQAGTLLHIGKSAFEGGVGFCHFLERGETDPYGFKYADATLGTLFFRLGYRYTFAKNRFFLKCGIVPILVIADSEPKPFSNVGYGRFWYNPLTFGVRF